MTEVNGVITRIEAVASPGANDVRLGVVVPGFVNAHSHAFHRALRGRTHDDGGDFWQWRRRMYDVAGSLDPDSYYDLASLVFSEMRDAGYTTVGEFHYLHHQPNGAPYPCHDMEVAVASAAASTGIRLVLLDTCYLRGGLGEPLSDEQLRFGDGTAHRWLHRWQELRSVVEGLGSGLVTLGAAIHSVRAVSRDDLAVIAEELPSDVPLHAHVSEQPAENRACVETHRGLTPTGLLAECGLLTPRFSAVHATHLTPADIELLGMSGATVVMCPTTEADLGDGIGPVPELVKAGAALAIGSDQHVIIDPFEELSRLELDQRLRLQRRGVLTPNALWSAGSEGGRVSLGLAETITAAEAGAPGLVAGDPCDLVEIATSSPRTGGALLPQLAMVARSPDVLATVVGGRVVARRS